MSPTIEIDEIAQALKCTSETVEAELRAGNLPGVKFGRSWVVPREAFWQRINTLALRRLDERRGPEPSEAVWNRSLQSAREMVRGGPPDKARVDGLPTGQRRRPLIAVSRQHSFEDER